MSKRLAQISLTILFFVFQSVAFAAAIFTITTTDQTVHVEPGGTAIITYTVQNTSGINMTGMKYYPPAGTTRTGGTCGNSLANGASCTVQLTFHAPSTSGTITLNPFKVCGRNGQICSQSNAANTVKIIIEVPSEILTITINPSTILQYQSLHVANNSSVPGQITAVTLAPALSGLVKWCQAGDGTCFQQSTCLLNTDINPGGSCDLWFQSLDASNIPLGLQSGDIQVDTSDGVQHHFTANYEMDLYASGSFSSAGGVPASNIARWDGSSWFALSTGITPAGAALVRALTIFEGDLYAGGNFDTAGGIATNNIARWNGTVWSTLLNGIGTSGDQVNGLVVFNGSLYAGGAFTDASGVPAINIVSWNGSAYSALGAGIPGGGVTAVGVFNNQLYATVIFSPPFNGIVVWDGLVFSDVGGGLTGGIFPLGLDLTTLDGNLYAVGSYTTAGATPANNIASWNGAMWSALIGPGNGIGTGGLDTGSAVTAANGNIYVGGTFVTAGGNPANRIAGWDPNTSTWFALGSGMNDEVTSVVGQNGDLYAGGVFTTAGGAPASSIARWDGTNWFPLSTGATGFPQNNVTALLPASSLTLTLP